MATGFKQATVNASSVPATQTNFPSYVDLSRLGITTQAEADSVRVYADSGKTTEWAREIVSVTEMHVKVPSLTSTVDIYVDWDGSSADYGVTDTYGRNAVWSDYAAVYHMNESSGNITDSTANGNTGTNTNTATFGAAQIGNGSTYAAASSQYFTMGTPASLNITGSLSMTAWLKDNAASGANSTVISNYNSTGSKVQYQYKTYNNAGTITTYYNINNTSQQTITGQTISVNTWTHIGSVYNGSNVIMYKNGAANSPTTTTQTPPSTGYGDTSLGRAGSYNGLYTNGSLDEVRVRASALATTWITTEYNNQNDEATFWGTWSDVGGGGGNTTNFFMMA